MIPRDQGDALLAAFSAQLGDLSCIERKATPWHSATFAGTRYEFAFSIAAGADHARFVREIGEAEIPLRRGFVADVSVMEMRAEGDGHRILAEALTIDAD